MLNAQSEHSVGTQILQQCYSSENKIHFTTAKHAQKPVIAAILDNFDYL